jgi:pyrroloquinoline-quinone synthase
MDEKDHWGWRLIVGPQMTKSQLLVHFQQEYEVYVRDFPILLYRVLGRMNHASKGLKREFAENIYEEQTGGLSKAISKGLSHPDLFLKMMRGLGFKDRQFENIELLPTSLAYRSYLDLVTLNYDWRVAACILGLFVEGSREDRERLGKNYKPTTKLSEKLRYHSLAKYHGLKERDMDLVKAHYAIEGSHRKSAWETLLNEVPDFLEADVEVAMLNALDLWHLFRDGVCLEMGLVNPAFRSLARL